ncbi:hypothetical protein BV22DRAFT_1022220 [Leucogyrophana mollusca]|uniref:Uncharacterized protein n=1 Tax=Leucogyrophana mollusca TaxID=85980 RepID=A0ACB8B2C2_9AGAM|nr:hypothetical protein BV22DRAFT_1022220 [Leucogyrophana mollusca]
MSGKNRSWLHNLFKDHPGLAQRLPEAYANFHVKDGKRGKAMCKECLADRLNRKREKDLEEIRQGRRQECRDEATVVAWRAYSFTFYIQHVTDAVLIVWALNSSDPGCLWINGRPENFITHLKKCPVQPDSVHQAVHNLTAQTAQQCSESQTQQTADIVLQPQYYSSVIPSPQASGPSPYYNPQASLERCKGAEVTLQTDGWTGINFHHLLAFMMTTGEREVHTIWVTDVSSNWKTAVHLKELLIDVMKELEATWRVTVVAITSDASGESRAARKQLVQEFPWLVAPNCYAHQIAYNQSVGQQSRVLAVICAVLTRLTAHYLAFKRLLNLKWALDTMVRQERDCREKLILIGDAAARRQAHKMFELIDDPVFWQTLTKMVVQTEPLTLMTNIAQAAHCRLNKVIIIFGYLLSLYLKMDKSMTFDDHLMIQAIIKSLERQWSKSNQDIFIAAIILNPIYKNAPFAQLSNFTNAGIYGLICKLWKCFYQQDPPTVLYSELRDYLNNTGESKNFPAWVAAVTHNTSEWNKCPDPLEMYNGIQYANREPSPLQKLARRLFSICANSASCKCLFSVFGTILTRLHLHLHLNSMVDLAELHLHLRDEYARIGDNKERLCRKRKIISSSNLPTSIESASQQSTSRQPHQASKQLASVNSEYTSAPTTGTIPGSLGNADSMLGDLTGLDEDKEPWDFTMPLDKIELRCLFNFHDGSWTKMAQKMGMRSLDDELEFYELIDMDAEGDNNDN